MLNISYKIKPAGSIRGPIYGSQPEDKFFTKIGKGGRFSTRRIDGINEVFNNVSLKDIRDHIRSNYGKYQPTEMWDKGNNNCYCNK